MVTTEPRRFAIQSGATQENSSTADRMVAATVVAKPHFCQLRATRLRIAPAITISAKRANKPPREPESNRDATATGSSKD
jgi:hypothetical protein